MTRKPHWEINVQGVQVISDAPSIVVREAITQAGFDPDKGWFVFLKVQGQPKREVALADPIDLRMPGIERLRLTPRNVDNGEAPTPRRDFALLDADEDHLDRLGLRWETVLEGKRRWLLIHGYRMPSGYTVSNTELAIEVPPTYPQAALGFYAYPPRAHLWRRDPQHSIARHDPRSRTSTVGHGTAVRVDPEIRPRTTSRRASRWSTPRWPRRSARDRCSVADAAGKSACAVEGPPLSRRRP